MRHLWLFDQTLFRCQGFLKSGVVLRSDSQCFVIELDSFVDAVKMLIYPRQGNVRHKQ